MSDDDVARQLLARAITYTPELQQARRRMVRGRAAVALELLRDATRTDDPDELAGYILEAHAALSAAVVEIMRAHLG